MKQKSFSKIGTAVVLVLAITASLWFAAPVPVKALELDIDNPSEATIGSTYTFDVEIAIEDRDLLPVKNIDLKIADGFPSTTYEASCPDLPVPGTPSATDSRTYTDAVTGGGAVSVSTSTAAGWGYATASRSGYGYMEPGAWGTGGYHDFGTSGGYGYKSDSAYRGETSVTFAITWTVPSDWPEGTYYIRVWVYGNGGGKAFIDTASFSLSAVAAGRAGAVRRLVPTPGVTDVSDYVDRNGVFTDDVTAESEDGKCRITIDEGTTGLTEDEEPLSKISIIEMEEPPPLPEDFPANAIALTYDIEPDGATFDQSVTITFTYDESLIPDGVAEEDLVLAYYDESLGEWVILTVTVNTGTNTITAGIRHFTAFTVLALTSPAAFTASDLAIVPDEVDIGEEVTISLLVTNTGDLAGSYEVTLNIDGVAVATEEVTVAGGASKTATFTAAKNAAGTYEVTANGLSGTFVVKKAPVAPPPPTPPTPTPAPAPPPAPPVVPPVMPPTPINWWLIGGIIAGVIVIGVLTWQFLIRRRA